ILGLLSGIGPLCTDFYLPALPEITQQLQATSTQTQLSLTAALIGLGLGQLFFGPLSDRIGRLKPLALSLLLIAAAIFITTLALPPSPWVGALKAISEAAMVGALADWFAVVALFRRIPLPFVARHTAII
ncbi:MFS transporter, partial [Mycobacterium tuberculosis]|nr:MFS transporter [Mycobacterium tuberculosis]